MHSINFVHCDIKPDNIMFSPTYRSLVFIDFGLSNIVREPIGFKSKTRYKGTLNFSSEEMKKTIKN